MNSNANILSTGDLDSDSVVVAYNDLRKANAKMIELKYTKEINVKLNNIISNDSVIIRQQVKDLNYYKKKTKKYKTGRNIAASGFLGTLILFICAIL